MASTASASTSSTRSSSTSTCCRTLETTAAGVPYDRQRHLYDKDRPELQDFLTEFRALVDSYPERMTVGELFAGDRGYCGATDRPRHLVFDFMLLHQPWSAAAYAAASDMHEELFTGEHWPTVVLGNHDNSRPASRLAPHADPDTSDEVARAAAVLALTLRGTPFLYYGDEIGARDVPIPWDEIIDPPAKRGGRLVRRLVPWWNRDQARSPMPWGDGPNGGFSEGRPWIRMAPDVETRNVALQDSDPSSVLSTYRRLVWLRRQHPALQSGTYRRLSFSARDLFAFEREGEGEAFVVAVNFGERPVTFRVGTRRRWSRVFDTHDAADVEVAGDDQVTLAPRQAIVLQAG